MNRTQLKRWLTAVLDGSAADEQIKMLPDMSYEAAASKKSKRCGKKLSNQNDKDDFREERIEKCFGSRWPCYLPFLQV